MRKTKSKPNNKTQRPFEKRKDHFFLLFSREAKAVRDSIVKDLAAYNMLLSLEASSFEEIALRQFAVKRQIPFHKSAPPVPDCPYCDTEEAVRKKGEGLYFCQTCKHSFSVNHNSISSGTKVSALTWMKVLQCILDFKGMTKTCDFCDITLTTYYKIRNRLFYAMQLLLDEVKLYGNVEVDNTFVRVSYKGVNLHESEFPEESIFFDPSFKPRTARQRGGSYRLREWNANNIDIFTAIDDRGHILTRFAGVGSTSFTALKNYIPSSKFLSQVPQTDPFRELFKEPKSEGKSKAGDTSVMISDGEFAIKKYAAHLGFESESHVYRRDDIQMGLPKDAHNIQRVNALHHRLKTFLRKSNYVSTRYLPGYLILFEFIENTKASQKAILRLFEILATPNLGKHPSFYQNMFAVPNYLEEWLQGDHPLKKLPYNKLVAFYLYDHIRNKEDYPDVLVTMEHIQDETGYTAPTIRKIYRDLNAAGYRELILKHFGEPEKTNIPVEDPTPKQRKQKNPHSSLHPIVLAIFDEYAEIRTLPPSERKSFSQFLQEKNEQYGTSFKRTNMLAKFDMIVNRGIRPPLPDFTAPQTPGGKMVPSKAFALLEEYEKIVLSFREKGENVPKNISIFERLGKESDLSAETVGSYITLARAYRKSHSK